MKLHQETILYFEDLNDLYRDKEYCNSPQEMIKIDLKITNLEYTIQEHCYDKYALPWFRVWTIWKTSDVISTNEIIVNN